jgi:hypothetical protein
MEGNFQEILDSLKEKPPRSRLEPYRDLIEELVKRGRTYREIRHILAEECGVRVALSTLHSFLVPHSRSADLASSSAVAKRNIEDAAPTRKERSDGNTNESRNGEVRQRIEALKQRKLAEKKPEGFSYDPSQPLRLLRNSRKGASLRDE